MEIEKILALAQYLNIDYCFWNEQYLSGLSQEKLDEKENELLEEDLERDEIDEKLQEFIDENTNGLLEDEFEISSYNDSLIEYGKEEYLVYTDSEADDAWDEDLDNFIDDCVLHEIPERYRNYFDNEAFKNDCKYDGRGHSLGRYDGQENEEFINGTAYYIYRQN